MSAITEADDTVPNSDEENPSEFMKWKKQVLAGHRQRAKVWIPESKRAYQFMASRQWSPEDEAVLKAQNRPPITFNRCAPIINAVCGLEVNNRQGVVYLPREQGDVEVNETITAAGKWVRDRAGSESKESTAFRDNVICGEGWTEMRMDYDEDPKGKIMDDRIFPLEMGVGAGDYKANHSNAKLIYRVRTMDIDDARALLELEESVLPAVIHAAWFNEQEMPEDGGKGFKRDYPDKTRAGITTGGKNATEVRVVQLQYWKREPVHVVAMEGKEEIESLTPDEFKQFEARANQMNAMADQADQAAQAAAAQAAAMGVEAPPTEPAQRMNYKAAKTTKKTFYECFLLANRVHGVRELPMGCFSFLCMTAEYDEENKCFYGMLRSMFDPQMWANKWLSQTMHILNTNAKGGLIVESDVFTNPRKAMEDWSDPTKMITVKPGAIAKQKIKERTAAALPQGLDGLMMFAISSIRDVTGVNLELLGQADREQAASLEMQRRQSAMTILATIFDSLRTYRIAKGRLTLQFVYLLPTSTLIRVVEKGQVKYIPLVKDTDIEKFDTIVDEAPSAPDQKQYIWSITEKIMQMGFLPPAALIELLKYSPYPASVVQELRKAMGVDGEMAPEQMQEKLKQAEGALQVMEQELKKQIERAETAEDDHAIELMQVEIAEYKAETERLRARWDARAKIMSLGKVDSADAETSDASSATALNLGGSLDEINGEDSAHPQAPQAQASATDQKIDQLTQMVGQLLQALQPAPQQPPMAEPQPQGEV